MSGSMFTHLGLLVPEALEVGGRASLLSSSGDKPKPSKSPRQPALGKGDSDVSQTPAEIQAALTEDLQKYVDAQPTPERQAEALIKIGTYRVEVEHVRPMLKNADDALRDEVLEQWFQSGDVVLRKMVYNAAVGTEELPLAKIAEPEGPETVLAKMLDDAPVGTARIALLQKMDIYAHQLREIHEQATELKTSPETLDKAVTDWTDAGDRSHQPMKKALADAEARRRASSEGVSHKDVVDQSAGNASSHAGRVLGGSDGQGTPDSGIRRSIPKNSKEAGSGKRLEGSEAAPGQADGDDAEPGSGPNDAPEGGGEAKVEGKLKRKGTTGGLGSVAGADGGEPELPGNDEGSDDDGDWDEDDAAADHARKIAEFAPELKKIMPAAYLEELKEYTPEQQEDIDLFASEQGLDLRVWSNDMGKQLRKSSIDQAVNDWMAKDAAAVEVKRFVAEALASAEQIPMALGKAIMEWQAAPPKRPRVELREPFGTARAA